MMHAWLAWPSVAPRYDLAANLLLIFGSSIDEARSRSICMNPVPASLRQAHTLGLSPVDGLPAGLRLQSVEVECVLARSSGAVVYRGLDLVRTSPVVIKEFLPTGLARRGAEHGIMLCEGADASVFERARQAFVAEGHLLQRCRHPSLMRVLQVLEQNGTAYRVMPHCPGPSLLEHRRNMAEPPTEKLLRTWLEDLLGALAELHAAGRVHGAVAPRNILVLPGDRLLLLDSNAVSTLLVSDQTRTMIAALPPCVAPREQTEPGLTRLVGPWTDLYSLAATLHLCMTGDVCDATDRGKWPGLPESLSASAPRATSPNASHLAGPAWLAALSTCLAENPEDRPQSVSQLRRLFDIKQPVAPALALSQPVQTAAASRGGRAVGTKTAAYVGVLLAALTAASRGGRAVGTKTAAYVGVLLAVLAGAYSWLQSSPLESQASGPPVASASHQPAAPSREALAAPTKTAAVQDATPTSQRQTPTPAPAAIAAQSTPTGATRPAPSRSAPPRAVVKTVPAKARTGAATPREACGRRERYELLQCMQTQCAKKNWIKHEQCVRLRKDRKL